MDRGRVTQPRVENQVEYRVERRVQYQILGEFLIIKVSYLTRTRVE